MASTSFMRNTLQAMLIAFMSVAAIGVVAAMGNRGGAGAGEQGAGGEEGGTLLTLDQTHDAVRLGAHLIMGYDANANAFIGTVKNSTNATLQQVRVEIHLSSGTELGPTTPRDLAAGESMPVRLDAPNEAFDGWVPHPEVGPQSPSGGEGGDGSEGSGGEGSEGSGSA